MNTNDKVRCALMCAITCILGLFPPIYLPIIPVPITLQSLGIMLSGSLLGSKKAFITICIFLLIIAIGVPILPGMRGGIAVFLLPSAGFLFAWPFSAYTTGWFFEKYNRSDSYVFSFLYNFLGGIVIMYLIAIPIVSLIGNISLSHTFLGSLVFIPGDVFKAVLTAIIIVRLKKYIKN
jgi:biotin transport system substrate-specific component